MRAKRHNPGMFFLFTHIFMEINAIFRFGMVWLFRDQIEDDVRNLMTTPREKNAIMNVILKLSIAKQAPLIEIDLDSREPFANFFATCDEEALVPLDIFWKRSSDFARIRLEDIKDEKHLQVNLLCIFV